MDITTVGVARKDGVGQFATSVSKQNSFTRIPAESACSTSSDSDEECLRPSLLRKRRQPREICHPGNVPTNHQTPTGRHTTLSRSYSPELQQQQVVPVSDHYCSPVRQTPFAPLSPSCPSSGAPSRSCFTPTAEHDLFGSPATSVPPEGTPACRGSMFDSPGLHKQMRHADGPSKALAHISRLQRELTHLLQQIKGHEQQQQQAEVLMQDADFLHSRLQALKSSSGAAEQAASQTRGAETEANPGSQPAKAKTLELWQQLSSESSNSNEAHQLEELQAQLCHTTKQLRIKEEEVVGLTIQLVSVHTQLDGHQTRHAKPAQQPGAVHSELAQSAQQLQATKLQLAESAQPLESTQQCMEELTSAAALAKSLQQQQQASQQHADSLAQQLEQSHVIQTSFSSQLHEAQAQVAELTSQLSEQSELRQSAILAESSLTDQLEQSQQQRQLLADRLEQSQASCSDFSAKLSSATQQLEQLSDAHVMDESTILDQLSDAQDELQRLTCELAESQGQQAVLSEQLEQVRCEHEEAAEAHTVTEATLLDQLHETQAELDQSSIQVRHFEQRHQEMCQQLTFARVGQAEAMQAANESKEQLSRQLQSMQADHQTVTDELLSTQASLSAAHHQLQEEEGKHAAANRELSQSGMQSFELSQRLQESQTQLSQQLDMSGKLQAKLKKSRASQLSLLRELELAKAETVSMREQEAEAVRAQLEDMRSQLDAGQAEDAHASDVHVQLQGQLHREQADNTQAHAQIVLLNSQVAQLTQQLAHSHDKEAQLAQQLQAVTTSLESAQTDSSQAVSECLELHCQLRDTCAQLEQSCRKQAEYAVEQQRGASDLQAAHAESSRLAGALAQAERAKQAVDAQLKDIHSQHRKLRAKAEQVAVRCACYDSLQVDLAETQTQLAAHCAHVQVERQRSERVTQRLVVAGNMLSKALYNLQPASPQLPRQGGAGVELGSTAEQVCSLVEALLAHQASSQSLTQTTDPQPSVAASRPVDALRSHVAQAQARANHIVDEFQSMLLVTGPHSMKEVMHIQSQAGLAESTAPLPAAASAAALPLAGLSRPGRKTSPALKGTARQTRDSSTSTGPPSLSTSNSSGARRSGKSSVTGSKENRAPALTYVTGGQIRGARRAHEPAARQPLKPSIADNSPGLSTADVLTHKARTTGVHKLKH